MKTNEIIAVISKMEEQLAELKSMVLAESNEGPTEETPVIEDEVEDITLPEPPAVVYVDMPKDNKDEQPDEDAILGCKIITDLGIDYSGVCSVIKMHKLYFDNGQPKLYINKYKVVIDLCNSKMEVIKSVTTHWNNLAKFHTELIARGINTHAKENWMPKTVLLDLD